MKTQLSASTTSILSMLFSIAFSFQCQSQVIKKVKDIRFANSFPFDFTLSNNKLFFIATDNTNAGVFVTDGTDGGKQKLTSSTGLSSINDIVDYNNKIYFTYNDGINEYELWVSDGTLDGTTIFKDINPLAPAGAGASIICSPLKWVCRRPMK